MTDEEAKKMLKAKLECLKRETSGMDFDCTRCNCDECSLNYEQGNIGEQKEALKTAIKVLEQTRWIPVKWHIKTEVEEYEQYPEGVVMLDSPMPADGEDVLITIKGKSGQVWVEKDTALKDEDGWYTDGGYDWVDDVIAWMPLPHSYKLESEG